MRMRWMRMRRSRPTRDESHVDCGARDSGTARGKCHLRAFNTTVHHCHGPRPLVFSLGGPGLLDLLVKP